MKHMQLVVSPVFLLFVACQEPPDSAADAGFLDTMVAGDGASVDDALTGDGGVPFNMPKGGSGHSNVGATLKAKEARAGVVTKTAQLLSGIKVEGKVGDFKKIGRASCRERV